LPFFQLLVYAPKINYYKTSAPDIVKQQYEDLRKQRINQGSVSDHLKQYAVKKGYNDSLVFFE